MNGDYVAYINDDGTFTDDFFKELPEILGDEFKGQDYSEFFKRAGNLQTLFKNSLNTKRAFDTKLENVIQKPAADATDEQKAEYRKSLLKEIGAVEKAEDFGFGIPTLPDGMQYDAGLDKFFAELMVKAGIPKEAATMLRNGFIDMNISSHNERIKAENDAFETSVRNFETAHPGEQAAVRARLAHDFFMDVGSDDVKAADGTVVKGLKTILKEADIYNNPTDYKRWRDNGIGLDQIEFAANLVEKYRTGRTLPGGGGPAPAAETGEQQFIKSVNAGSPDLQVQEANA